MDEKLREAGRILRADPSQIPAFLEALGIPITPPASFRIYEVIDGDHIEATYTLQEWSDPLPDAKKIGEPVQGRELNGSIGVPMGTFIQGFQVPRDELVYFFYPIGVASEEGYPS